MLAAQVVTAAPSLASPSSGPLWRATPQRVQIATAVRFDRAQPDLGGWTACQRAFCLDGTPTALTFASGYAGLGDPQHTVDLARAAGLDAIRVVNFLDESPGSAGAYDEARWRPVDAIIAAASRQGLSVVLDLSTYRNLVRASGGNPYLSDWSPFLQFVADRVNTVSGVRYAADPTIALVSLAGEPDAPVASASAGTPMSTQQLTDFYARTTSTWHRYAPQRLVSTGGLLYLDWPSGIDWQAIMALPYNAACNLHVYSSGDQWSLLSVSSYCAKIGKPLLVEEFGRPQSLGDQQRADWFDGIYRQAAAAGAAGTGFWNLGSELRPDSHDVNPSTPLTWQVVRAAAAG